MTTAAVVRSMRESDLDAVDVVLRAAFGRPSGFLEHARLTRRLQPDGVFVAERDGAIVGTVGAVDYGSLAYVGLMGVAPAEQSRGIGRLLMQHLLAWVDGRGCPVVLLDATERGALLYESLGFVDDALAYVYVRPQGDGEQDEALLDEQAVAPGKQTVTSDEHALALAGARDLEEIVAFDAARFGGSCWRRCWSIKARRVCSRGMHISAWRAFCLPARPCGGRGWRKMRAWRMRCWSAP